MQTYCFFITHSTCCVSVAVGCSFCFTLTLQVKKFFNILVLFCVSSPAFGAILQGSLFGLAGILPASYTTPIMSGQGLAGAFAAFSMICALASTSHTSRTCSPILSLELQQLM